jgi:ATP-dependent 26S proteasome regulatory subunit
MNSTYINGIPSNVSPVEAAVFRTRISTALTDLCRREGMESLHLNIGTGEPECTGGTGSRTEENGEFDLESRAERYQPQEPLWSLEQLVAPENLLEELHTAISLVRLEPLVFDTWGLRSIEPFPRSALNFHGGPGTGKTLAAHAVASALGKQILVASYAQIESKYHGDGPKNVEAIFHAAQTQDAVLFIDEADSLLSRRLTNVTQGSEQAINSMRSQILICLERHKGVVIFATNLAENYDRAFESRIRHIHFPQPDLIARTAIWKMHLPEKLPLHPDVEPKGLAGLAEDFCGRDIKNAVVNAALTVAQRGDNVITHDDLALAVYRIKAGRAALRRDEGSFLPAEEKERLAGLIAPLPEGSGQPAVGA